MNIWAYTVILFALVGCAFAQYGIPDDDDDDLPPVRFPISMSVPILAAKAAPPAAVSTYTKYEDNPYEPVTALKAYPMYQTLREAPAYTEPMKIAIERKEPSRFTIRQESISYKQESPLLPVKKAEEPAILYSAAVVKSTPTQLPTQIRITHSYTGGQGYSTSSVRSEAVPIVKYIMDTDHSGTYRLETASADGAYKTESGQLKHLVGDEKPVVVKFGSYGYTGDDGKAYHVEWKADEDGFRAFGSHLPTPPPALH